MKRYRLCILGLTLLGVVSLGLASSGQKMKGSSTHARGAHVLVTPDQIKWGPPPSSLPTGAEVAILEGDPLKPGAPFTIRGRFPDGYKVPPHWHPTDERVVVLQGTFGIGVGNKFDPAAGREMPTGSYALMPKSVRHYAWAIGETVIQVSGIGPFEVYYVNPADDPRKASKK